MSTPPPTPKTPFAQTELLFNHYSREFVNKKRISTNPPPILPHPSNFHHVTPRLKKKGIFLNYLYVHVHMYQIIKYRDKKGRVRPGVLLSFVIYDGKEKKKKTL